MPIPNLIENKIITTEKCSYGCEGLAKFSYANGKFCCSRTPNNCPSMRKRNIVGVRNAHRNGKFKYRKIDYTSVSENLSKYYADKLISEEFDSLSISRKKKRVIYEQNNSCAMCNLTKWLDRDIVLEVDHIDGNVKNNTRKNLRALCPNCHSMTPTWRRKKSAL